MKSIRSIYIYIFTIEHFQSLFFSTFFSRSEVLDEMFGLDKCVEKRRHTHLLHTQSGNLSRSRYACAFILLNWIFQLDESNIATPRPKLETGSRAETGRFEFDSCRVRVPREKFEWKKETKEKKKDKFWLYPDIVRKYISEARNRVPFRRTRWPRRCEVFWNSSSRIPLIFHEKNIPLRFV